MLRPVNRMLPVREPIELTQLTRLPWEFPAWSGRIQGMFRPLEVRLFTKYRVWLRYDNGVEDEVDTERTGRLRCRT